MSVWGNGGRIELTVAKFMAFQKTVQPDWYQSMCDGETWQNSASRKRVRKSVDRTLAHLDECLLVHQKSKVHSEHTLYQPLSTLASASESCIAQTHKTKIDVSAVVTGAAVHLYYSWKLSEIRMNSLSVGIYTISRCVMVQH